MHFSSFFLRKDQKKIRYLLCFLREHFKGLLVNKELWGCDDVGVKIMVVHALDLGSLLCGPLH